MDGNITLIVKAANQSVPDHRLECDAEWTILKVKGLLSSAHPSKPKVEEQRLIYSGQLLLDDLQLRNVLRHPAENNAYTIHLVCSPPRHASPSSSSSSQSSSATAPRQPQPQSQPQPPPPPPPRQTGATPSGGMTAPQQEAPAAAPASSEGESSDGLRRRNVAVASSDGTSVATPQGIEAAAGYPTQAQVTVSVLQATADPIQQMATMQQMYANYMAYMQYIQMGGGMPWPQQMLHHIPASPSNAAAASAAQAAAAAASPSAESVEQQAHQPQAAGDQNVAANLQPQQPQQPQPQIRMNAQGGEVEDDDENEGLGRDWLDWIYVLSRMVVLLSVVYFYSTVSRFMIVVCIALLLYLYQAGWFRPTRRAAAAPEQPPQQQGAGAGGAGEAADGNENEADEEGPDDRNNNVSNNNNNNEVPDQLVMENIEQQQQQQQQQLLQEPPPQQQQQQQPQPPPLAQENNNGVTDRGIEADELHVRPSLLALSWTFLTTFFTSLIPEQPQVI
ncbi:homocysteine-responsive endoplasmic reticulum-resident ubiquitin-like domain member 2 protein [Macrobrachium rosenbergii]|uniref:homocysteine-responsive endoplasmic reticulum-resident ubiquitin-like domain member 2 protein n=1 Tax=Macrobrachium rosenbergii TaxID=79674 RepID=UPI0034D6C7CA